MERSILEGIFARGDRRLSKVLQAAYNRGAHFDAWDECFNYNHYLEAFKECDLDPAFYAHRTRNNNELFPWDHLAGNNRRQLHNRLQNILKIINSTE